MSRTVKGSKGWGYEFWGKRGGGRNSHGAWGKGPYAKHRTHRAERADGKESVRAEIRAMTERDDPHLFCIVCAKYFDHDPQKCLEEFLEDLANLDQ